MHPQALLGTATPPECRARIVAVTVEKIRRGTPAYRHLSIAMLIAGLGTFAVFYCVQPLLPLFGEAFGVKAEEASLVVSLTIGPMAFALPVAGILSDRIGRRALMTGSLFAGAACTLAAAAADSWTILLALRLLAGLSLAGVPAVAMTYIAEEVEDGAVSHAMGLYVAGTALGGMVGRLSGGLLAGHGGWRAALAVLGAAVLGLAVLFWRLAPQSAHFASRQTSLASYRRGLGRLFTDRAIPWLIAEAFLLMGAFVTLYNYISYRLLSAPYGLSHAAVGAIFVLFVIGSFSSALAGRIAGRLGPHRTFWILPCIFFGGILLTTAAPLFLVIAGVAVITAGFFGAHSVASAWVGRRAGADRAQASALYLLFYYVGGSVVGSVGGFAWTAKGWTGVALFSGGLIATAVVIGGYLAAATAPAARALEDDGPT